jgi:predicted branched-subunit amino acid permease
MAGAFPAISFAMTDENNRMISQRPVWSWAGFRTGIRVALPVTPGMLVFGIAVGTAAARKGLSFADSAMMNVFIYAGAAQMIALEVWPAVFTWGAIAALAILTAVVNARLILMSASMQPWLGPLPNSQSYPALFFLTDPGWLLSMRYRAEGGRDVGVYAGSAALFFVGWLIATTAGYFAGASIADPRLFGLDLVMPIFFAVMLVPLWRGMRRALAWVVAGVVALIFEHFVPGWWFIIAGSVAGALAGGFLDDEDGAA